MYLIASFFVLIYKKTNTVPTDRREAKYLIVWYWLKIINFKENYEWNGLT